MSHKDLSVVPKAVRDVARVRVNGEVEWSLADAPRVINALADAGLVIVGLDLRSYPDGQTFEVPWSSFEPDDGQGAAINVEAGRQAALDALARENFAEHADYAEWILSRGADQARCRLARRAGATRGFTWMRQTGSGRAWPPFAAHCPAAYH